MCTIHKFDPDSMNMFIFAWKYTGNVYSKRNTQHTKFNLFPYSQNLNNK